MSWIRVDASPELGRRRRFMRRGERGEGGPSRGRPGRERFPQREREPELMEELPQEAEDFGRHQAQYGRFYPLGNEVRYQIRAGSGVRVATYELRPNLYLVAMLPREALAPGSSIAGVLTPLVLNAASNALQNPQQTQQNLHTAAQGGAQMAQALMAVAAPRPAVPSPAVLPGPMMAGLYAPVPWATLGEVYDTLAGYGDVRGYGYQACRCQGRYCHCGR